METERYRSCKTGIYKSSTVDRRWSSIRSSTERLFFQDEQEKEKRAALKSALTAKVEEKKFVVVDEIKFDEIKTKNFANILKNLEVSKALVVLEDGNDNAVISAKNIADVKTAAINTINVYDILKYNTVIATKAAVAKIEEVYA